jgi:hypothetical protein
MKGKDRVYSMRVTDKWLDEMHSLSGLVNNSQTLGRQSRERGVGELTTYDLVVLAVDHCYGVADPGGQAKIKVGQGFQTSDEAYRRLSRELVLLRRMEANRHHDRIARRERLHVVEGEAA